MWHFYNMVGLTLKWFKLLDFNSIHTKFEKKQDSVFGYIETLTTKTSTVTYECCEYPNKVRE